MLCWHEHLERTEKKIINIPYATNWKIREKNIKYLAGNGNL
jgi:hypothetical protein